MQVVFENTHDVNPHKGEATVVAVGTGVRLVRGRMPVLQSGVLAVFLSFLKRTNSSSYSWGSLRGKTTHAKAQSSAWHVVCKQEMFA